MEQQINFELEHMKEQFDKYVISSKLDINGNIICVSEALSKISGYTKEELLGKSYDFLYFEKSPQNSLETIREKIEQLGSWKAVVENKHKSGTKFYTEVVISGFYDLDNNLLGYSTVQEDVTAKTKLVEINNDLENIVIEKVSNIITKDQQLLKHAKLAAMGEMMNAIAHQWKQPINAISMSVSQIEMCRTLDVEITDEILDKIVNQVYKQVDDMVKTINEFREFFNPNKKTQEVSLKENIQSTIEFLDDEIRLNNLNVEVKGDDATFSLIPHEFKHVFINLIANAKDAFIENEIKERYINIDIKKEDKLISIDILDNAGGIPSQVIGEIFNVDVTFKKNGKGTGIGLYMSTQIIEKLNGILSVENKEQTLNGQVHKGACFNIKLPI